MVAGKPGGATGYYHRSLETGNYIPALRTCIDKHLGIVIPCDNGSRRDVELEHIPHYLPVFVLCRLAPLLYQRHSIPSSVHKEKVATLEHITYNLHLEGGK